MSQNKVTVADIANNCGVSHYWDKETLRFFGQTRKSFTIRKIADGIYRTSARIMVPDGKGGRVKGGLSVADWKLVDGLWKITRDESGEV